MTQLPRRKNDSNKYWEEKKLKKRVTFKHALGRTYRNKKELVIGS